MDRKRIREGMLEAVNEQLAKNEPPEVQQTLKRLLLAGWSESDSKMLIAQCLTVEIFNIGKYNEPYNHERYVNNLHNLPEEPFDDVEKENADVDNLLENNNLPTGIKIGRNEKVTVKYVDGEIKEAIKFKKVKDDLLNGFCELVN